MCTDFPPKNTTSGECFYFSISVLHFLTAYFTACRSMKCVHVPFCIVSLFLNHLCPTKCAGVMYSIKESGRSCSSPRKSFFPKFFRWSFPNGDGKSSDSAVWHFAFYFYLLCFYYKFILFYYYNKDIIIFICFSPRANVGLSWTLSESAGINCNELLPTETSQPNPSHLSRGTPATPSHRSAITHI